MKKLFSKMKISNLCFAGFSAAFVAKQSTFDTFWTMFQAMAVDAFKPFFNMLATLILAVFRWILSIIDFCFVLIRQISGMNTDFSSLESIAQDDIIFQFIFNEEVMQIVKNLVFLAIAIIIVLSIIAIIKSEYKAVADENNTGKISNSKAGIWKNIFQSCLLLVLVPVVTIGGIAFSNAILQTLYNATTYSSNLSVGSQIFVGSSYTANAYRMYAEANQKIPITYNIQQITDYSAITDWDTTGTSKEVANALEKYLQADEWTQTYATFELFYLDTFFNMDEIDYYQMHDGNNAYNVAYDKGIKTYKYEYYVNADFQDYMLENGTTAYLLTVEEVYNSLRQPGISINMGIWEETVNDSLHYAFKVDYKDDLEPITYYHPAGATDEADGAVFLMCKQNTTQYQGNTITYYEPITGNNSKFESDYLETSGEFVVAKGFFDEGTYPTAIKKVENKIICYRDVLNIPTFSSFFPHISYEPPEGTTVSGATNVISSVVNFVTGVDISDFIPYLYFNIDFSCLYNKVTRTIVSMDNSSYYLDYVFSSPGIEDENVYNIININWVILIMASCIILSKVVKVFFGLMKRSVDIMFLYLVYPAAAATIPLYGKSSFGTWVKEMVNKALSLYGLVMGINLTLILIPISMEIEIFAPTDMSGTVFGFVPSYAIPYMNAIFQIFFLVVGISFIFDSGKVIQSIIEKQKDASKASDMEKQGGDVFKGTKSVLEEAAGGVAGKNAVKAVKFVTGFIPGISAAKAAKGAAEAAKKVAEEAKEHQRKMKEMKEARKKALEKAKEQKEAKKAQKEQKKEKKNPPQGGPGNPPPDGTQNPPAAGGTGGGTPQGGPQNTPPTGAAQCGTGGGAPQNGGTGQPATAGGNSQGTQPEATAVNDADPNAEAQAKAAAAAAGEAAETKGGNGGENADASGNGAGESGQPDNGGEEGEDQDDAENNNDSDAGDSADQDDNNADKQADAAAEDLARTDKNIARNKNAQNKGLTEDIEELGKNAVEQTKTDIQNLKEEKDKDNSDK